MLATSAGLGALLIPVLGIEGAALSLSLPLTLLYVSLSLYMAHAKGLCAIPICLS